MENISEIWVINLPECVNRLKNFNVNMNKLHLKYNVFQAIDGKKLSKHDIQLLTTYWCRYFICSNGIIGCYLSHYNLWKELLLKHIKYNEWYLILEDDSILTEKFVNNIKKIFDDITNWNNNENTPEYINCANTISPKINKITSSLYKSTFVNGTSAYLINVNGLKKLVNNLNNSIQYHIDFTISIDNLLYNDLAYYITDNYVINNDQLISTVSNTYPKLIPHIFNYIFYSLGLNNHLHIVYDSSLFVFHRSISINIFIICYIFIIAIGLYLLSNGQIYKSSWIFVFILFEIIWDICFLINKSPKNKC